jgi:hypothetical protein
VEKSLRAFFKKCARLISVPLGEISSRFFLAFEACKKKAGNVSQQQMKPQKAKRDNMIDEDIAVHSTRSVARIETEFLMLIVSRFTVKNLFFSFPSDNRIENE